MGDTTGNERAVLPEFRMPPCSRRHFFKGYRWWCRYCRDEAEGQFREVCEAWWASQLRDGAEGSSGVGRDTAGERRCDVCGSELVEIDLMLVCLACFIRPPASSGVGHG